MQHHDPWWRFATRLEIHITDAQNHRLVAYMTDELDHPAPYYLNAQELILLGKYLQAEGEKRSHVSK